MKLDEIETSRRNEEGIFQSQVSCFNKKKKKTHKILLSLCGILKKSNTENLNLKLLSNVLQKYTNRIGIGGCKARPENKSTRPMKRIPLWVAESVFAIQKTDMFVPYSGQLTTFTALEATESVPHPMS